jgi:enamine deaminase RidA (YjgF/YER057c/UK114 family)
MPGNSDPPADPYHQMRRCLEIVGNALHDAGVAFEDVVRTRVYLTDAAHIEDVMRAHGEVFGSVRPACTGIVCGLLDPRWLVELEVEAVTS